MEMLCKYIDIDWRMKPIAVLMLFFLFISCNKSTTKKGESQKKIKAKSTVVDLVNRSYNIGTFHKVSGKILGLEYHAFLNENNDDACIINSKNDTLFKDNNLGANPIFIDFDKDGITDVLFKSNIIDVYDFIKFDPITNQFKKIEGFNEFPEPQKIGNSKYWFSYQSNGCADGCWESNLFFINNFKTIKIGTILKDAGYDESSKKVFKSLTINKVANNKVILFKSFDHKLIQEWEKNKFKSIKKYWNENYSKFVK